jgi:hypothetical protein
VPVRGTSKRTVLRKEALALIKRSDFLILTLLGIGFKPQKIANADIITNLRGNLDGRRSKLSEKIPKRAEWDVYCL